MKARRALLVYLLGVSLQMLAWLIWGWLLARVLLPHGDHRLLSSQLFGAGGLYFADLWARVAESSRQSLQIFFAIAVVFTGVASCFRYLLYLGLTQESKAGPLSFSRYLAGVAISFCLRSLRYCALAYFTRALVATLVQAPASLASAGLTLALASIMTLICCHLLRTFLERWLLRVPLFGEPLRSSPLLLLLRDAFYLSLRSATLLLFVLLGARLWIALWVQDEIAKLAPLLLLWPFLKVSAEIFALSKVLEANQET